MSEIVRCSQYNVFICFSVYCMIGFGGNHERRHTSLIRRRNRRPSPKSIDEVRVASGNHAIQR